MLFQQGELDGRGNADTRPGHRLAIENRPDQVLAMSYVKRQEWREVLEGDEGLARGTIFPELEKPFQGKGGRLL